MHPTLLNNSLPLIKVTNMNFELHQKIILNNINFQIYNQEIITIVGPNGAGKSTLIKALLGFINPTTGAIIKHPNLKIGYVPQKIFFPSHIPIDVMTFLYLNNHQHNIMQQLTNLAIDANTEFNINNLLNKSVHTLSGGELQRVLLVKALLNQPNLLILDEPTKSVDLNGQAEFYKLCSHLKKKIHCAILMASHDLHFVMSDVNYVICLNKHICCHGLPEDISKEQEFINIFGCNLNKLAFYQHNHNHHHNLSGDIHDIQEK